VAIGREIGDYIDDIGGNVNWLGEGGGLPAASSFFGESHTGQQAAAGSP
jgi:hypothetical protein